MNPFGSVGRPTERARTRIRGVWNGRSRKSQLAANRSQRKAGHIEKVWGGMFAKEIRPKRELRW